MKHEAEIGVDDASKYHTGELTDPLMLFHHHQ